MQTSDIDTIISTSIHSNKILAGTTVLPLYTSYMNSVFGLTLENVYLNCDNDDDRGFLDTITKINSVLLTDSTLTVEFEFSANCCHDFLCYLFVKNDEILQLDFVEYGDDCACYCFFKLIYFISIDREYENDFSKLKYLMIEDNPDTMVEIKNKFYLKKN